jgi:hypothetical protein
MILVPSSIQRPFWGHDVSGVAIDLLTKARISMNRTKRMHTEAENP